MAKRKKHHQEFPIKHHDYSTVGRLGGGQFLNGMPWYLMPWGVGYGGSTGYGNDQSANETAQNGFGQGGGSDSSGESGAGATAGDGGGSGSM